MNLQNILVVVIDIIDNDFYKLFRKNCVIN